MSETHSNDIIRPSLFILVLMISVGPFGDTEYIPSLTHIARDFGVTYNESQLTVTSYLFGFALCQLFYGPFSDRFGRKPCMLFGACMFIVGSTICYFSHNINLLISGRFVQAIGACAGTVLANAAVRDSIPDEERGRTFAKMNAAFAIAPGIGPVVGGYVDEWFGWRANFAILLLLSVILFVTVWFLLPETNHNKNPKATDPKRLVHNYFSLLKDPYFLPLLIIMGLCVGVVYSCLTESPGLVQLVLKVGSSYFALIAFGVMFGFIIGSLICNYITRYLSQNIIICIGLCIMLVSSLVMGWFVIIDYIHLSSMLIPIIIIFLGIAFVVPMATAAALEPFAKNAGTASAMLGFTQMAIASLGTIVISFISNGTARAMPITFLLLTCIALLVFFVFIMGRPGRQRLSD